MAGLFILPACDLDMIPESDLSDEIFLQTDRDFRQAVNYLYKAIEVFPNDEQEYPLMVDVMSDNAVSSEFSSIGNGTYLPSSDFGPWDKDYRIIRAANNIIEQGANFGSESASRYVAEAKFFRAYAYADLVSRYGDVPLIMKTLDTEDEALYAPRTPRAQVIAAIYSDLDEAAANLPAASALEIATEYGMVTSGTALTLKSRVALREGTWNKFHNSGDVNAHLQVAKDAALAVIQSNEYELFNLYGTTDSYKQLFKKLGEGPDNKEAIWVYPYGPADANAIRSTSYAALTTQGFCGISKSLVDAFLCTDGLPIDQSPLYQGRDSAFSEFENRDPRLNGTVVKEGDTYITGIPFVPNLTSVTGYAVAKYFDQEGTQAVDRNIDWIIMRYAEVLLNYAEATFELNDAISDQDLDISINLLRDRVGMPHLTNAFVAANGLNMREEIRRERRIELGMEGFRYDDLLRWKTAEVELPKEILGVRLFAAEYPGVDPSIVNITQDSIVIAEPASKRSFDPSKHYLWPLPLNQLALNPNLEQNSNW